MVAHSLSRAEAIEALEIIHRYGGVAKAARATGQVRETLQARKRRAKQILESEIEEIQSQDPLPIEKIIQQPKPRVRVQVGKPEGTQYRVLAIGDAHDAPHIPKDRFYWMGKYAADSGVDWVVQIGDMQSLDSLNTHDANDTLKGKMKDPWQRDMQSGHDALGEFNRGLGSHSPKKHETEGNHERRLAAYENSHPEMGGVLTGELDRLLHQYGWSHTPYGEYFFLGGVGFIHAALNRLNKTYGGKNAEATIANDAVFDHVIGHSHVKRDHTAPKLGPSQHVTVLNLGCALPWGHVESYMSHGALTGWWWGCYELAISGGHITDFNAVSMLELERRYAA